MKVRTTRQAVLIALLALLATRPAMAQRGARKGEKYALVVGVRKYNPNELRSLPYSESDAADLAAVLKGSGYRPGNIVLMTQAVGAEDDRFAPRSANIRAELKLLLRDLEENDSILVALAGHGVQFRGESESYFCPSDTRLTDKSTLIGLGEVYRDLEASGAGLKVLLVDACRNDPQSDNSRSRPPVALESVTRPQRKAPPGGVVAFFSCSEGEKAYEHAELKHGVFFHYVIEALKGDAAGAGESEVLIPDLEKYVKRHVRDFVREKYGVRQMPELRGTSRDLVPLVSLSREPPGSITNTLGMKLVLIPKGEFQMGSPDSDQYAEDSEKPQHRVRITRPFYLGATEVTVGQFRRVVAATGFRTEDETNVKGGWGWDEAKKTFELAPKYTWRNPGFPQTDEHPVVNVSWNDAIAFCDKLSGLEGLKPFYKSAAGAQSGGDGYRLPTEAEWEYACRAGTTTRYESGDDRETLAQVGNIVDGTAKAKIPVASAIAARDGHVFTAPVGQFRPNAFGLFDMHGNVWEWCWDWYDADYYLKSPGADPSGPLQGTYRVVRGGSWHWAAGDCRAANRDVHEPTHSWSNLGLRLARVQSNR